MAATTKAALKAAKSALDSQDYVEAVNQASAVLKSDPKNYFGHVFLGRAHEKKDQLEEATKAYEAATRLKPDDELAWKGLCAVCEAQGSKASGRYITAAVGLAQVYAEKSDLDQCQATINKLTGFVKANGTRQEYKEALKFLLPTSPIFDFLEGRLQPPVLTYTRLAEITEAEETERINKEIGERRTRLGAKIGQVKAEVTREVFAKSDLESLYQNVIDWSSDDEIRREYEEKLLRRAYDHMLALVQGEKKAKRDQVTKLAHEMVIIKHPYRLAWDLELNWPDIEDVASLDKGILREFVQFFPDSGVAKVIQAYQGYVLKTKDLGPIKTSTKDDDEESKVENSEETIPLSTEERLLLLSEGTDDVKDSYFAYRLTAEYYLQIEEHESCVDSARKSLELLAAESQKCGLRFQENNDTLKTCLATSLVYYQSPKNHPEAQDLFNDVLSRKSNSTAALLGIGLVYEEQEQYHDAASFLERALARDPDNIRIGAEASWCRAQTGELETGCQQLQAYYDKLVSQKGANLDLKALIAYRVGKCIWAARKDKASRKDRKGAYAYFLAAIKANPNLAPPYTGLGLYYADYAKDKKRARQCFQKAFELSGAEVKAAERLARSFADDAEWEIVEIIAQRVIDSGVVKPAPGSKKKGISWPFAAMGVVQMNKQEYPAAVVSFQAALRISPQDYNSWVGLGESYHSSGRYNAAKKTLEYAVALRQTLASNDSSDNAWFADYMLANVHRELSEYEEALTSYRAVLERRPQEFGVSIALLQTLIERSEHSLATGFFGQAAEGAREAITAAANMNKSYHRAFNFWKAVGDACMIFSSIPNRIDQLPAEPLTTLVAAIEAPRDESLTASDKTLLEVSDASATSLVGCLDAAIKAHRNSIVISEEDFYALAVGWYNLGWTQYRASLLLNDSHSKTSSRLSKQAVRSFKRAIELEAGNADFWNALGVVTTSLNPKIAQHSFVRSLHLNERSARAWTNLGALYLLENDHELAHQAFSRAQSTDPEFPYAWLGEGLIALLVGDMREALSHFTHAVDIADASATTIKSQYLSTVFDHILQTPSISADSIAALVTPIFAAQQLQSLALDVTPHRHLLALLQERVGDYTAAVTLLEQSCAAAEAAYETTESPAALAQYIRAKADLARNQLATHAFADAIANADTALSLSELDDGDDSPAATLGLSPADRNKCRLSAHMTAGLAHYASSPPDHAAAVAMFRAALTESGGAPDVVCLLAQMLWAAGGTEQRGVAQEQLFSVVERHTGHVGATTLLGAIALLSGDADTLDAVVDDLQALRIDAGLVPEQRARVERLLRDVAAVRTDDEKAAGVANAEVYRTIMLHPAAPAGWAGLATAAAVAESEGAGYAAAMAATVAEGSVPPRGVLGAEDLARAYAGTGWAADAQKSIMAAPWLRDGWESLQWCSGSA